MTFYFNDIKKLLDSYEIEDIKKFVIDYDGKKKKFYSLTNNQKTAIYILIQSIKDLARKIYKVDFDNQKQKVIEYKKNNITSGLYNPELKTYRNLIKEYFGKFKITSTTRYISGKPEHQNAIDISYY
ncbi:MAG: hypothetical protein KatS3mg129_2426 [Leptospiraceae bacterium]|nr:MAG: hypothetical protein KatS3mg129_2426 [Leptospiraceae bacterium]